MQKSAASATRREGLKSFNPQPQEIFMGQRWTIMEPTPWAIDLILQL